MNAPESFRGVDTSVFDRVETPTLRLLESDDASAYELSWHLARIGTTCRVVRGHKMQDVRGLHNEFGAALQFPSYYGENWTALSDCMRDLEWLPFKSFVLVVTRANLVLKNEAEAAFEVLLRTLERAGAEWAEQVNDGEEWDRDALPFHVLFQADGEALETLVSKIGTGGRTVPTV